LETDSGLTPAGNLLTQVSDAIDTVGLNRHEVAQRANRLLRAASVPGTPRVPNSTFYSRLGSNPRKCPDWSFVQSIIMVLLDASDHPDSQGHGQIGTLDAWKKFQGAAQMGQIVDSPLTSLASVPRLTSTESARQQKRAAEKERADLLTGSGVVQTLRSIYPNYDLVRLWDVDYPICAFPAPESEHLDWEAVLAGKPQGDVLPSKKDYSDRFDRDVYDRFVALNDRFDKAEDLGVDTRAFFSGSTYAFEKLWFDDAGAPRLDCKLGRYFASIATSEDLDKELMDALRPDRDGVVRLADLPRRSWLHQSTDRDGSIIDPVVAGSTRAAALSHATVLLVANGTDRYDLLLPFRSEAVATHAYFNHVAPSGILSPHFEDPVPSIDECSVERNFFREWVEEIYAQDAFERPEGIDAPDPEYAPEVIRLKQAISDGRAALYYTGVSVNLLTLRPEICLALVVHDSTWLKEETRTAREFGRPMRLGWEYSDSRQPIYTLSDNQRTDDPRICLEAPDFRPVNSATFDRGYLVPNAAAAIHLALRMLNTWPTQPQNGSGV
jgi:hypothetical protein